MKAKAHVRVVASLLVLLVLLAACGGRPAAPEPAPSTPPETPAGGEQGLPEQGLPEGGRLVLGLYGEPSSLIPILAIDGPSLHVLGMVVNGLVAVHGGEHVGVLAESWDVSEDGLTWTFNLRQGVTWHDGAPFTAADVVFTYEKILDPESMSPYRGRFIINDQPITVEAVGDYQVKITTPEPYAPLLSYLNIGIMPKHVLEGAADLTATEYARKPVGTGPFRVEEWRPGESVLLSRNDDYFKGRPLLNEVAYRIIPDQDAAFAALRAGDVDTLLLGLSPNMAAQLQGDQIRVLELPRDTMTGLMFNTAHPLLADRRVRQALTLALDRQAMVNALLMGRGAVGDSPFTQAAPMYDPAALDPYPYDPERARSLLREAGWQEEGGRWLKDGRPVELTIANLNLTGQPVARVAEVAQNQWGQLGITVNIETLDIPTWLSRTYTAEKQYEIAINRVGPYPDPDGYRDLYRGPAAANPLNYDSEQVNALFAQGAVELDPVKRMAIYGQIQELVWEDIPFLVTFYEKYLLPLNQRVVADEAVPDANVSPPFRHPEKLAVRP